MKIVARLFLLSAVMFTGLNISHAEGVDNLRVEATTDYINIFWDDFSGTGFEGYALQFSDRETDVQINKNANLYLRPGESSVSLRRNSFGNNVNYYTRISTYGIEDETNAKIKANGSYMLKWDVDFWNNVESSTTDITDPVVVTTSGSSTTVDKDSLFEFGELRSTAFDTFINLSWSKPVLMATSDFDGFLIRISENSDLSDPILEATYDRDETQSQIKGLQADTQYYAAGYFYENSGGQNVVFGNNEIDAIRTINAVPRDGSTRAARNIVKIESGYYGEVVFVDGAATNTTNNTVTTTTTTPVTTSTSTVITSSAANISSATQATVRARITAINEQISELQTELRRWQAQLDGNTNTSTSATVTTSTSTTASGNSRLSKIKALLEARRSQ